MALVPRAVPAPVLIALAGLPGVGKTTLARAVARHLGAAYLRIDTVEQALRAGGMLPAGLGVEGYAAPTGWRRTTSPSGIRRDHEAQAAALERAGASFRTAALTAPQRAAIGQMFAEQRATLGALQRGSPNFDAQWISAQVAAHEKALTDLRALGPVVAQPALHAYAACVARLTAGVPAHLQEAQRLQTRPGSSAPAPGITVASRRAWGATRPDTSQGRGSDPPFAAGGR